MLVVVSKWWVVGQGSRLRAGIDLAPVSISRNSGGGPNPASGAPDLKCSVPTTFKREFLPCVKSTVLVKKRRGATIE